MALEALGGEEWWRRGMWDWGLVRAWELGAHTSLDGGDVRRETWDVGRAELTSSDGVLVVVDRVPSAAGVCVGGRGLPSSCKRDVGTGLFRQCRGGCGERDMVPRDCVISERKGMGDAALDLLGSGKSLGAARGQHLFFCTAKCYSNSGHFTNTLWLS